MTSVVAVGTEKKRVREGRRAAGVLAGVARRPFARELLIFLAFTMLTALMTWPWVTRLRDAVVDPGDPYLLSWVLWWDFHQTFHNPLHLFDANIFYPLRYTLAFTENDYGISLLFFPLFALGLRPLTVNSLATFFGFAFCGYGAFRLTRTLSGSNSAAWVAGVVFAFIPYRFHLMSQVHYVFTGWMPLTLEALVLFARERSRRRAAWLGAAFTMNALTCLTWFILSLTPLALTGLFLVARYRLARDRDFWLRGAAALGASALVLMPFLLPYSYVSKAYGFTWGRDVVERNSPTPMHWLMAEYRNRLWKGFGDNVKGGGYKLFPGLLTLLLALASAAVAGPLGRREAGGDESAREGPGAKWVRRLDALAVVAGVVAFVSAGWAGSETYPLLGRIFAGATTDRAILVLVLALAFRLSLAYPRALVRATGAQNLVEHVRATRRGEAFWVGAVWAVVGFFMSLGMNSWLFRVHFDLVFLFRGMREPSRAAMVASLGLSVLAGVGAARVAAHVSSRRPRLREAAVVALIVVALLAEFRAAPLRFTRGAVYPDALTLRLKDTPMRGGLVELPTGGGLLPHLYMLRAADHGRPLVNAISTFVPPHASEIDRLSQLTPIPLSLLDRLEEVPTSYLVIHNPLIDPARRSVFEAFVIEGVTSGRLRFIRRYGEGDDLYAVVKTEPGASAEGPLPFGTRLRDWSSLVADDPVNLLGANTERSQQIYRLLLVAGGSPPKYAEFMGAAESVGRGLFPGSDERAFRESLRRFAESLTTAQEFKREFGGLSDESFVEKVYANAGVAAERQELDALSGSLSNGSQTRAGLLLEAADDPRLVEREKYESLVRLHYFGYLRRNPGDPPDRDTSGFDFWVADIERSHDPNKVAAAFSQSVEYNRRKEQEAR